MERLEKNSNVFKFQGSNMLVSAKGPNIDKNVNMSTSFRSNLLSSTMNMPRNFEKQSYTESVVSQRSIYYGRETSPTASIRSDLQPRNFHQPFYQRGFSQRSAYNSRGASPVSMRSIDSSVSTATDIVQAIRNGQFKRYEIKMIKQELNNKSKHDFWKAEKRRKMRMYLKNLRNGSEDDSGDKLSNSSTSSDDCVSTRTGHSQRYKRKYKENIPRSNNSLYCQSEDVFRRDNRDAFTDYGRTESQNPYQKNTDLYHPENIIPYQKEPQLGPGNIYLSQKDGLTHKECALYSKNKSVSGSKDAFSCMTGQANIFAIQRNALNASICSTKSMQNTSMMSQKDRFTGGFQFPSQRFKQCSTLYEENEQVKAKQFPKKECAKNRKTADHIDEDSDENEDIFLDTTVKPRSAAKSDSRQKRKIDSLGDLPATAKKKPKITSIIEKSKNQTQNKNNNAKNEFEFVRPQLPIRKSAPAKCREKMISKSPNAQELNFNDKGKEIHCPQPAEAPSPEPDAALEHLENTQLTNSDVSMRPSFMKRKLFTQTLDVTERNNNSSESLGRDSPQSNIYSALSREKHKTRKLVTSQSLLSRDVQDDNNLLDLIHKIVPPNQVNSTITTNTTKSLNPRVSENKTSDDKWDITSIIYSCNNDSVSDTYTDDEIFKVDNDDKKSKSKAQDKPITKQTKPEDKIKKPEDKNKSTSSTTAKVENKKTDDKLNKISRVVLNKVTIPLTPKIQTPVKACPAKKKPVLSSSRIDAFWNTDVESDYECVGTSRTQKQMNLLDHTQNQPVSQQSDTEIQPATLSLNKTKLNETHELSPLTVLKSDTKLVKVLKKQTNMNISNKTESKILKKSNDDTTQSEKPDKTKKITAANKKGTTTAKKNTAAAKKDTPTSKKGTSTIKKGTPTITLKTRRQINLSITSETNKNSRIIKGSSPNKSPPVKIIQNKQTNEKKAAEEKNKKIKSASETAKNRIKPGNASLQIENAKNLVDTPRISSRRLAKNNKVHNELENNKNDMFCKILRSRALDLSSSFNSDKFELTMTRTRKSRTPSKRISFNKSKNIANNKTRSRATKA